MLRQLYPRERDPLPILQEAVWAPGPIWRDAENFADIRPPDLPARSESVVPTELSERREMLGINSDDTCRSAQIDRLKTDGRKGHTASFLRNNEIKRKLEF